MSRMKKYLAAEIFVDGYLAGYEQAKKEFVLFIKKSRRKIKNEITKRS